MTSRNTTKGILIGTAALLLVTEVLIVTQRAREGDREHKTPTISKVMQEWGRDYALLPYTTGVLAGHWWWNQDRWLSDHQAMNRAKILLGTALIVFAWDLKVAKYGESRIESSIRRNQVLFLGLGIVAGHFMWPQKGLR